MRFAEVVEHLRNAYANSAKQRDEMVKHQWKLEERGAFLELLRAEGKTTLLEIGAGTGQDGVFFRDNGLDVVATDLTPAMVEFCRAKGLDARVMDMLHLEFADGSFDAVWTINTLLHVPNADLSDALAEIGRVLRPGGLLYLGVYGGDGFSEGTNDEDTHEPKRFFSFRSDEAIENAVREHFDLIDFHVVPLPNTGRPGGLRFQSLTLRRPSPRRSPVRR